MPDTRNDARSALNVTYTTATSSDRQAIFAARQGGMNRSKSLRHTMIRAEVRSGLLRAYLITHCC